MRIQYKLFILLIVIAILPLAALSWRSQVATERLGSVIAERGRLALSSQLENQLRQAVGFSATILFQEQKLVETALKVLTAEIERRLEDSPSSDPSAVFFHDRFDARETWPPGTELSNVHQRLMPGGTAEAMAVSKSHQSFYVAPGVDADDVIGSLRKLASLDAVYQSLNTDLGDLLYWQYAALSDGLHTSFPGHGGYPNGFDPRRRVWYRLAVEEGGLIWTPPTIDAATRQLLLTVAMPVRDKTDSVIGVAAMDVQILSILRRIQNRLGFGADSEGFIVRLSEPDGRIFQAGAGRIPDLRIVANAGYQSTGDWDTDIEARTLQGEDKQVFAAMLDDMLSGRDGLRRMPYKGRDSLWVYGRLQRLGATLLYIVPYDTVASVAEQAQAYTRQVTNDQLQIASVASVLLIGLVGILSVFASRSVTGPLRELAAAAKRVAAGDFNAQATVFGNDEVGQLARAFNGIVPELKDNMGMRQSLSLASEVQQKLLPATAPMLEGLDIAGRSVYCDQTGGDYFDFLALPPAGLGPRVGVSVGDVTGHGISSALTMTTVRALLRAKAHESASLSTLIDDVNRHLSEDATAGRFVTFVYLVIEPETRTVRWVNAGHAPVIVYEPACDGYSELPGEDIPLGVKPEWHFREDVRDQWTKGSIAVIGTDGIWEARNESGEMFGKEALLDVIRRHAHRPADLICDAVYQALDAFRGTAPFQDDVTLVIVKFTDGDEDCAENP